MDTIRLKFNINFNNLNNFFFSQKIQHKEIINTPIGKGSSRFIFTNNNWRKEREKNGIYTPKYWIEEDFLNPSTKYLLVEFSAPKLCFGTSLIKLKNNHLPLLIEKIINFFQEIKITITSQQILCSFPIFISFAENIDITKICSCDQAINILSSFDDRFRSNCYIIKPKNGGIELYYNTKSSTFKLYDKLREIKNNAVTREERKIIEAHSIKEYRKKEIWICEILRVELTLKSKDSIIKRLTPYIENTITLETLFQEEIWFNLLRNEIEKIFNSPMKNFVFLSRLNGPAIEAFLNKNSKHFSKKAIIKETLSIMQRKDGLKGLREYYFDNYKSRQTFYNHISILKRLSKQIDFSDIQNLTSSNVHDYLLRKFDIKEQVQNKLF